MNDRQLRTACIKLAHDNPEMREHLLPLLRFAGEEESAPAGGAKKGPPPGWDAFMKDKYEDGKKKVPNPSSETRKTYPQVSVSTAMKVDAFKKGIYREFSQWRKDNKDKLEGGAKKPEPAKAEPKVKTPEYEDYHPSDASEELRKTEPYKALQKNSTKYFGEHVKQNISAGSLSKALKEFGAQSVKSVSYSFATPNRAMFQVKNKEGKLENIGFVGASQGYTNDGKATVSLGFSEKSFYMSGDPKKDAKWMVAALKDLARDYL